MPALLPLLPQLVASIPSPPFRNLDLGPVTLHGYGLCLGLAVVASMALCEWGVRRTGVDTSRFTTLALLAIGAGFIGARLYHVLSEPVRYARAPLEALQVWEGGLGIYGGVLAGTAVGLGLAPRFGVPRRALADAGAPALLLAQAIGRWGNYLNQELFGTPFDGAWALEVDRAARPARYADVATFHPTFLYELLANAVLCGVFVLLLVRWRRRTPGVLMPLYVAAYSVVRLCVEPLRIDPANEWAGVRQNVWVAGALVVASLAVAAWMVAADRRAHDDGARPGRDVRAPGADPAA